MVLIHVEENLIILQKRIYAGYPVPVPDAKPTVTHSAATTLMKTRSLRSRASRVCGTATYC
jgi:hypothetical protein